MLQIAGNGVSRGDSMGLTPDTLKGELSPLDVIRANAGAGLVVASCGIEPGRLRLPFQPQ